MRFFKNKKIEIDKINLSTKIKIELIKIMSDLIDLNNETTNVFSVTPLVAGKKRKRHRSVALTRKRHLSLQKTTMGYTMKTERSTKKKRKG